MDCNLVVGVEACMKAVEVYTEVWLQGSLFVELVLGIWESLEVQCSLVSLELRVELELVVVKRTVKEHNLAA